MKKPIVPVCLFVAFVFFHLLPAATAQAFEILMFGDSLTQGLQRNAKLQKYGVTQPVNGARVNGSYGMNLEAGLAAVEASHCYNWGSMGEITSTGVTRINQVLASRSADFILIQEGANDLILGVSPSTTRYNLGVMIEKSKKATVTPILGEIMPMSCPSCCGYSTYVDRLNDLVVSLAAEKDVMLAGLLDPLKAGWSSVPYQSGDGLHISNAGYVVVADVWFQAIQDALAVEAARQIMPAINLLMKKK